jgi:hypothetical protein
MVSITSLWLPIVLSAVGVFVMSSIIHMVLKYHQSDYQAMPGEDNVLAAMRGESVKPGYYYLPHCVDMKQLAEPEMKDKFEKGPVVFATVMPNGVPAMGKSLGLWFAFCLVVGIFVAYLCGRVFGPGTDYMTVFRYAGTVAFLGYAGSIATESIWKGQPWGTSIKHIFDGLLYSLVTAGFFGWLWP